MNLAEKAEVSIRARKLFRRGQAILVAVSGGVDSMVLLHVLHSLAPKNGWRLTVAHCNHRLRGRASDADERVVCAAAKQLGLPFMSERVDVRALARTDKLSIEMAARRLRHDFLARTAKKWRIPSIALAHHADDQLELFFLRLFRGSGGEGLAGMPWRNPSPADACVELVRPLLDQTKSAVREYAAVSNVDFREDASNRSDDFQRNRIRHRLLPLLKKEFQPLLGQVVGRAMEVFGVESSLVRAEAQRWLKAKRKVAFARLPVGVQRRVLLQQLLERGITPEFELVERLRVQVRTAITISDKVYIMRDEAGRLQSPQRQDVRFEAAEVKLTVRGRAGQVSFSGVDIRWQIEQQRRFVRPKQVSGFEWFDADLVGAQVVLRHWRAGDRFQPIGMKAAVKLQDLFVNAKIPGAQRRKLIVATTAQGDIFWVEGLRMAEKFKLSETTRRRLRWAWKKAA